MKIFDTSQIDDLDSLPPFERELIYCGLDTMVTNEVKENLLKETDSTTAATYNTSRLFLGPAFDLMKRGFLIDTKARDEVVAELSQRKETLNAYLQELAFPVWKKPLNYNSPLQMKSFFYDHLFIPTQYETKKGERKISTGRGPLEKIERNYPLGTIFARIVMRLRDHDKVLSTMTQGLLDGRWHASFNVAGTDTFRWCVSGDTEILTPNGWKSFDSCLSVETAMVWDSSKKECRFESSKVVSFPKGPMIHIDNGRLSLTCTPEHKIPWYTSKGILHVSEAKERRNLHKVPLAAPYVPHEDFLPEDQTRICVMVQADGCLVNKNTVRFHFRKERKILRCLELLRTIPDLEVKTTIAADGSTYIYVRKFPEWVFQSKYFGPWLLRHSPSVFVKELSHWDGCQQGQGIAYSTCVEENAKWVKTMAHLAGRLATITRREKENINWRASYAVHIGNDTSTRLVAAHYSPAPAEKSYCLETSTGFFLVRHKGDISITGNSSSKHPLNIGGNLQNIEDEIRRIFVADPGWILFSCDQQGAEARGVAYITGDEAYIKAVESGDVHTTVASMVWGFEPKRELSDRIFYRDLSYRDVSKKFTHGSSYYGKPRTLAIQARTPIALVEEFQSNFFKNFPGIQKWHSWTDKQLQSKGYLITAYGDRRQFWGKLNDDSTLRSAIAFQPQHIVGKLTAVALYRIWSELPHDKVQILNNGHDAVIGQIKKEHFDSLMPLVLQCLDNPLDVVDIKGVSRKMSIPWEASYGANWGKRKFDKKTSAPINPKGLRDYKGKLDADALYW